MTSTVAAVAELFESLWPESGAEPWDAVGLVVGSGSHPVDTILLAVDAVGDTVDEAVDLGAQLFLTHHPLLLRGVTTVAEDRYKGALIARLIRADCALFAAHTNADVVSSGTSGTLASLLGLTELESLDGRSDGPAALSGPRVLAPSVLAPSVLGDSVTGESVSGIGRFGRLPDPVSLGRLARTLADLLPATATGVRVAGDYDAEISTVALCAGAGDGYLSSPLVVSADVFITSDLRHHSASEARENAKLAGGPALIDISHWASEWLWLDTAAVQLRAALPDVRIVVSELRTDPWDFVVTQ